MTNIVVAFLCVLGRYLPTGKTHESLEGSRNTQNAQENNDNEVSHLYFFILTILIASHAWAAFYYAVATKQIEPENSNVVPTFLSGQEPMLSHCATGKKHDNL